MLWALKHEPKNLSEFAGNAEAVEEVRKWALNWERKKKQKPLLLHGRPGIGKTVLARALAKEMEWQVIETNASDLRNPENLQKIIGVASSTQSLLGGKHLLLVDEVDSAFDRGEVPALTQIMKNAMQPIILTANNAWNQRIASIKALSQPIELKKVNASTIKEVLKQIAGKEKIECEFIEEIARNSKGDLRSAVNDLQAACAGREKSLKAIESRDREKDVFEAVKTVFKTMNYREANNATTGLDIDFELFIKWIEENTPAEYESKEEVAKAFNWLSRGDLFNGRIKKRQEYKLLKYFKTISLTGVALSKKQVYRKFTAYHFPSQIKLLSVTKKRRELLKRISLKMASKLHESSREAIKTSIPFIAWVKEARDYFGFNEEESLFLDAYKLVKKRSHD